MFGIDDMLGATVGAVGLNALGQVPQMLFNARQAAIGRDFAENLANTQVQRRVADAQAAGINPIFAVAGGSGAAVPGASTASVGPGGDPVSSAKELALMSAQVDRARNDAEASAWNAASAKAIAGQENTKDFQLARQFGSLSDAGVYELEANARAAAARADEVAARIERGIDIDSGVGLRYAARLAAPVSSAASAFRSFSGGGLQPYSRQAPGPAYLR